MWGESTRKEISHRRNSIHEPSTSKNEKKKALQAAHFLRSKHPELFEISPIPGGYHRHVHSHALASPDGAENKTPEKKPSTPTKGKASPKEHHAHIGDILGTSIRCPSSRIVSKDDQKNNTVRMCSIAISTVMMLAQHTYADITMEHVRHTQEYFRGLKQPDGYPTNVGQLMRLLTHLMKSGKIASSANDRETYEEEIEEEPQ